MKDEEKAKQEYKALSGQVLAKKRQIIKSIESLHGDLCELAALERALSESHTKGGRAVAPLFAEHLQQVEVPSLRIWSGINDMMNIIAANNHPAVKPAGHELPEIYFVTDRVNLFSRGK